VLGFVENMSGYACPCCGDISEVFSKGGGERMAKENGVHFLGKVPIDTKLVELLDEVSKGNIPVGTDVATGVEQVTLDEQTRHSDGGAGSQSSIDSNSSTMIPASSNPFPLLDRYLETTSSKIWKTITTDVLARLEERKALAQAELDDNGEDSDSDSEIVSAS
jgi:hypothetical protein